MIKPWFGASLQGTLLTGANLRGADMVCGGGESDPETGEFIETDCVTLESATLDGADLRDAKLGGANLRDATLNGADLRGTDLTRADLRDTDLTNADFRGATLTDAKLDGAKRTGARGLPEQLRSPGGPPATSGRLVRARPPAAAGRTPVALPATAHQGEAALELKYEALCAFRLGDPGSQGMDVRPRLVTSVGDIGSESVGHMRVLSVPAVAGTVKAVAAAVRASRADSPGLRPPFSRPGTL